MLFLNMLLLVIDFKINVITIRRKIIKKFILNYKKKMKQFYDITSKVLRNSLFHKKYNYLFNK